jgi:hypothetical protein
MYGGINLTMKDRYLFHLIELAVILLATISVNGLPVMAQSPNKWSPQSKILAYDEVGDEPLWLIADQNRTVHAFNTQPVEDHPAIVYRQWTLEQGWTDPIDIFLNSNVLGTFLDGVSIVHIAFERGGDIYYSKVLLVNAGRASTWSTPQLVGEGATAPYFNAAVAADDKGNLVIIYSGSNDGTGVYVVYSADNGDTWSEPEPIFLTYDNDLQVLDSQVYLGQSGRLHAVWSVVDKLGQGEAGYYARLDVEDRQWSDPVVLDVLTDGGLLKLGILTPSVIEYEDDIFVTYYNGIDNGNWWRRSNDGGRTWTDPVRISPHHKGTNGAVSFVVDSSNILHLFFGQRIDDNNHGMWHSVWQEYKWTEPEAVVRGPQVRDQIGGKGFDPRSARAVISQGNVALVTWATDGMAGKNGAWYSYAVLDTPELSVIALPTPLATSTPVPTLIATPSLSNITPSPTRSVVPNYEDNSSDSVTGNTMVPLIIGLMPVVLLISAIIIVSQLNKHGRH